MLYISIVACRCILYFSLVIAQPVSYLLATKGIKKSILYSILHYEIPYPDPHEA